MMKLNIYNVIFKFAKGEDLVIAGAVSRATVEVHNERPRIMSICLDLDITDVRLEEIR